jgi:hypothetical protein
VADAVAPAGTRPAPYKQLGVRLWPEDQVLLDELRILIAKSQGGPPLTRSEAARWCLRTAHRFLSLPPGEG